MPGLAYDESGALATYFAITFLSLILVPTTLVSLKSSFKSSSDSVEDVRECSCAECRKKLQLLKSDRKKQRPLNQKLGFTLKNSLLLLGWIAFGGLAYSIATSPKLTSSVYDPFEILGISSASDEKSIKRHYKKLSLKFHPDKIKLGVNETQEEADAKFVELTKAYKSLTDDTIRENLAKYGNPDGQQPREEKIAIPKWVIEGNNGLWVLAVYGLILGVGMPVMLSRWWFSTRSLTKDGAQRGTAETFFKNVSEEMTLPEIIGLLSTATEYRTLLGSTMKAEKGMTKKDRRARLNETEELEKRVNDVATQLGLGPVLSRQGFTNSAPSRRAAALLWSHLLRIDDLSAELLQERRKALLVIPEIMPSLVNIVLAHQWLDLIQLVMKLSAQLVQACPDTDLPIFQLPGVDFVLAKKLALQDGQLQDDGWQTVVGQQSEINEAAESENEKDVDTVEALTSVPEESKRMAKRFPQIRVTDASFSVDGEKAITPGSFIQFTYSVYLSGEGSQPIKTNGQKSALSTAIASDDVPETFAHAPRWPAHRKPHWWVMIGDSAMNRIIVQPQRIADIPIHDPSSSTKPRVKTYKLQFQAPPMASVHQFEAFWISDSFVKCGTSKRLTLKVVEPTAEALEDPEEDEISDPEEDTIEGQLAAMRGGRVKRSENEGDENEDDRDDSGSDSEGEGSYVDSDATTESEDEGAGGDSDSD